jgi:hypothetical protein
MGEYLHYICPAEAYSLGLSLLLPGADFTAYGSTSCLIERDFLLPVSFRGST